MWNSQFFAKGGDHFRFRAACGPQAMVDRRSFHSVGASGGSEQEHCEAVGTAGNGEAELCAGFDQCVEIGKPAP